MPKVHINNPAVLVPVEIGMFIELHIIVCMYVRMYVLTFVSLVS